MIKYLLLLAMLCTFAGCRSTVKEINTKDMYSGARIDIVIFEGCEYIATNGEIKSHKGNCKNPIHEQNKTKDPEAEEQR